MNNQNMNLDQRLAWAINCFQFLQPMAQLPKFKENLTQILHWNGTQFYCLCLYIWRQEPMFLQDVLYQVLYVAKKNVAKKNVAEKNVAARKMLQG